MKLETGNYMENKINGIDELFKGLNEDLKGGAALDRGALRKARKRNFWLLLFH